MRSFILSTAVLFSSLLGAMPSAEACLPPAEGWFYTKSNTMYAGDSGDALILLDGHMDIALPFDQIAETTRVTVSLDGEVVEGELEPGLLSHHLIWRASGPIAAGAEYTLEIAPLNPHDGSELYVERGTAQWDAEHDDDLNIAVVDVSAEQWERTLHGDCVEDGPFDSCGGCELEVIGHQLRWRARVELTLESQNANILLSRIAVGVDADEAEAILARTRYRSLSARDGQIKVSADGGPLARWPAVEGCVAFELARPNGDVVHSGTRCVEVPEANPGALLDPPNPTGPKGAEEGGEAMGCSASPSGASDITIGLFALLAFLGRRRRRVFQDDLRRDLGDLSDQEREATLHGDRVEVGPADDLVAWSSEVCEPQGRRRAQMRRVGSPRSPGILMSRISVAADADSDPRFVEVPGADPVARLGFLGRRFRRGFGAAVLLMAIGAMVIGCDSTDVDRNGNGGDECDPRIDSACAAEARGRLLPALVTADVPPVPISGGTLTAGPTRLVAADSDRGQVSVVRVEDGRLLATVELGGEPGRVLIDDGEQFAYVTDRAGTTVAEIELRAGALARRIDTCQSPRGLGIDPAGHLLVACQTGVFQRIDLETGGEISSTYLGDDLRDVVVVGGRTFVTRFRAAELLEIDDAGTVLSRRSPPDLRGRAEVNPTASNTAWRTIGLPDGRVLMLHQRAQLSVVNTSTRHGAGYGRSGFGTCFESIVQPTLTVFGHDGPGEHLGIIPGAPLAVDVAYDAAADRVFLAAAGRSKSHVGNRQIGVVSFPLTLDMQPGNALRHCLLDQFRRPAWLDGAEVTSVAVDSTGRLVLFDRVNGSIRNEKDNQQITLSAVPVFDAGHDLFHKDAGGGLACASCHPEGRDDGHTWLFADFGLRRTQSLTGGLKGTEPFHWEGDMPSFHTLTREVMGERMGGPRLNRAYSDAMLDWLDTVPSPPARVVDTAAVARGQVLFHDPVVGCAGCHSGGALTDNRSYDVGTGGILQTPSLRGIASRAPFMHDGCATVLEERFTDCGGGDAHGQTSHLEGGQVADLVAYMKSL